MEHNKELGIPAVEVKGLTFGYSKGDDVLSGIDLSLREGGRYALLGPNGAGKTTLLKLMDGLLRPSSGEIRLMGRKVHRGTGAFHLGASMLFQDPDDQVVMPTLLEDTGFGPLNMGLPPGEVKRRAKEALSRVGLAGLETRSPHTLSFGEKRRAAIAGVISMEPKVLLLDEPTANLDPRGRRRIISILKGLECTMVIATQDMEAVMELANEVIVLDRKVLGRGPVRDIMTDDELMAKAGLEAPEMVRFFCSLKRLGIHQGDIPLTSQEALEMAKDGIGKKGYRSNHQKTTVKMTSS